MGSVVLWFAAVLAVFSDGARAEEGFAALTGGLSTLASSSSTTHSVQLIAQNAVAPKSVGSNLPAKTRSSQHEVIPIFLQHCAPCHGAQQREGELDLRTKASMLRGGKSGPALILGKPDESLLVRRIQSSECPPNKRLVEASVKPVAASALAKVIEWITSGAPEVIDEPDLAGTPQDPLVHDKDRDFWSFRPPRSVSPPSVRQPVLVRNAIDAFVLSKLEAKGLSFAPEASKSVLLRRIYFDLTSDSEAACLQSLSDSVAAVETADIRLGDSVAIFGQGSMGLECLQIARLSGAGLIITVDVREESCRISAQLGADHALNASSSDVVAAIRDLTGGTGADVVFECAGGSPKQGLAGTKTVRQAIEAVRSGGKLIGVSWFGGPFELDVDALRERSLRYLFPDISTQAHLEYTVRLVATGRVSLRPGITHVLEGIESVPQAFEITANKGKYHAINPAQVMMRA